ncbi:MAG TPA: glycosyltransferase [Chitinophagaceae bacterium]|nr:glycosyltransferase [Chitinophagaceae bacterium]
MKPAQSSFKPRILVAPLDWGLGHATRCIPVIRTLITTGAAVWLAGDGPIATLLKTEFPELPLLPLQGYDITYGKTSRGTRARLVRQMPRLRQAIRRETAWLAEAVATYKFDAVISDNRYGLHHPAIPCIFITHQLRVRTGARLLDALLQTFLYQHINRFAACWVPDEKEGGNLAGALAHPAQLPKIPVTYIGLLSRFRPEAPVLTHYILVLLSGPEPQRTVLEELVLQQAKLFQNSIFIVRGLPGAVGLPPVPYHVTIVNHLPAATLQKAIAGAQYVIARCGYSTVMDMATLQKKCIFIPTPAQTEQAYLAQQLLKSNKALCIPQQKFQLKQTVALADFFPYQFAAVTRGDALQQAVEALLQQVWAFEKV